MEPAAAHASPRHRLVAGDPTALADAYTRHGDRLLAVAAAAGQPPAEAAAVARAVLVEVWEHPLRFPADDAALAETLAAAAGRLAAERSSDADEPARRGRPEPSPGFLPDWRQGSSRIGGRGPSRIGDGVPAGSAEPIWEVSDLGGRDLGGQRSGRSGPRSRPARPSAGPAGVDQADPRAALLAAALARRPAVAAAPPFAAPFAAWTAAVDRVLAELSPRDWDRPTGSDGRTPREVVARLAGLDAALAGAIGIPVAGTLAPPAVDTRAQGILSAGLAGATGPGAGTVPDAGTVSDGEAGPGDAGGAAGAPRADGATARPGPGRATSYWPAVFWPPVFWPPVLLWRTWHEGARGLCAWLAGREPESAHIMIDALGWTAPVEDHLTSRVLGTWLDGAALAAAAGVQLPALDVAELSAVTELALHRVRWRTGPEAGLGDGPLALTLIPGDLDGGGPSAGPAGGDTGAGGVGGVGGDRVAVGRWLVGPGRPPLAAPDPAAGHPSPAAELRLGVVDFCLLAAGRRTPAETAAAATAVGGDPAAGHALLAGAAGVLPA
ncbi:MULTISPECIES: hypothetical protein [unclassified Pseudofrankia]|uniref:hypothetical protein n=1 Tax=unclassified Pseudofrankia TaxID=2994372 RepID=UPI001F51A887|nr:MULTISPECIES: hypothetical protein [unclassified Pseudofrankia]MDT3442095.1 hypothetical protein [Pseudofrankia sp. BMG5.37]